MCSSDKLFAVEQQPNNSFKPNLLRYSFGVAGEACHAKASTTQVGLTQALGLTGNIMAIRTTVLATLLLTGCVSTAQTADSFSDAARLFAAQPRTEATDAYGAAWVEFNNAGHLDERDGCYFKAEGRLVQILQIDANGKVVGYFADKDNGRSQCWRQTYMGITFPKPPFAPFYHRLEMQ